MEHGLQHSQYPIIWYWYKRVGLYIIVYGMV